MDVRAIILLGGGVEHPDTENIAGVPFALINLLGHSVLQRTIDNLRRSGVEQIVVIGDPGPAQDQLRALPAATQFVPTSGVAPWRAAQQMFAEYAQSGADLVFVFRLGAYLELDYESLIQHHLDQQSRVTAVCDGAGDLLDVFVISGSRRNDAAFLLRHRLRGFRAGSTPFVYTGYHNPLTSTADFRRLAVDMFAGRVEIRPDGSELRPGVWVASGARIDARARVLAPAYIGAHARIGASAVVTRCGVVEHHAVIDCGTVVEDASVLPYTLVGAGLDVSHSIVGFRRVNHLRHDVEVEIDDPKLVSTVASAPVRVLGNAVSLATFLPVHILRGLVGGWRRSSGQPELSSAVNSPAAALNVSPEVPDGHSDQFAGRLVIARSRYGDE